MNFSKKINEILNINGNETIYYLHIPKTAGMSLVSDKVVYLGHRFGCTDATRSTKEEGGFHKDKYWKKYEFPTKTPKISWTVIRNPFDWLVSYYFHGTKLKPNGYYEHTGWANVRYVHKFRTFKDFVRSYCNPKFKWHVPLFKQFTYSQLFDDNGNCIVDFVVKFEFLEQSFQELNKANFEITLNGNKNPSLYRKKRNYKDFYTDELREMVQKKCQRELELFHYDFNGSTDENFIISPKGVKYDVKTDKLSFE